MIIKRNELFLPSDSCKSTNKIADLVQTLALLVLHQSHPRLLHSQYLEVGIKNEDDCVQTEKY